MEFEVPGPTLDLTISCADHDNPEVPCSGAYANLAPYVRAQLRDCSGEIITEVEKRLSLSGLPSCPFAFPCTDPEGDCPVDNGDSGANCLNCGVFPCTGCSQPALNHCLACVSPEDCRCEKARFEDYDPGWTFEFELREGSRLPHEITWVVYHLTYDHTEGDCGAPVCQKSTTLATQAVGNLFELDCNLSEEFLACISTTEPTYTEVSGSLDKIYDVLYSLQPEDTSGKTYGEIVNGVYHAEADGVVRFQVEGAGSYVDVALAPSPRWDGMPAEVNGHMACNASGQFERYEGMPAESCYEWNHHDNGQPDAEWEFNLKTLRGSTDLFWLEFDSYHFEYDDTNTTCKDRVVNKKKVFRPSIQALPCVRNAPIPGSNCPELSLTPRANTPQLSVPCCGACGNQDLGVCETGEYTRIFTTWPVQGSNGWAIPDGHGQGWIIDAPAFCPSTQLGTFGVRPTGSTDRTCTFGVQQ